MEVRLVFVTGCYVGLVINDVIPVSLASNSSQWPFTFPQLKIPLGSQTFFSIYHHYKRDTWETVDRTP